MPARPHDALETLEAELCEHLGEGTVVYEEDGTVRFYNEDPAADFSGLTETPRFSTNLLLDEGDDSKHRRIERFGDWLLALDLDEYRGTPSYVSGEALRCEPGSSEEREFVRTAALGVCTEAGGPLRSALDALRQAGVVLNAADRQALFDELFGSD